MPKNKSSLSIWLALVCCTGCTQTPRLAYVDINQIIADEKPTTPKAQSFDKPPTPLSPFTITQPGEDERILKDPSNTPKLNVREMFEREQAKALIDLTRHLRQFYDGEIKRFRLEQELAIAGAEQDAYRKANDRIRAVFEVWANERLKPFTRLAFVAGFPDPNPNSAPKEKQGNKQRQILDAEAKTLRTTLQEIDNKFKAQINAVLSEVLDASSADQAALQLKINKFADDLDKKSAAEAQSQIRDANSQMQFSLADSRPIVLPSTPAHKIEIVPDSGPAPSPKNPSTGILESESDRLRFLQNELSIWAGLNRYKLTDSRKGAIDATHEFQEWRKQHGAGP